MNVDIHTGGIDFQKQAADRVTALHQRGVIAFQEREVQAAVFHRAAIDEQMLLFPGGARQAGRTDETPEADRARPGFDGGWRGIRLRRFRVVDPGGDIHGQHGLVAPVQRPHPLAQGGQTGGRIQFGGHGGQLPHRPRLLREGEGDFGISQRRQRQIMVDVGILGFLGAQKFSPRGQVEKQLPHFHASARRTARRLHGDDFSAVDDDLRGVGVRVALAGGQGQAADAGDARQGLAAKAHRGDGAEVFGALNFAGGVAFQAEERVVAVHAGAVVGDADEAASARLDDDVDAGGLRVEGVLDQLLDDAGRPFHHFARGDLVGDLFGQQADAVHGT